MSEMKNRFTKNFPIGKLRNSSSHNGDDDEFISFLFRIDEYENSKSGDFVILHLETKSNDPSSRNIYGDRINVKEIRDIFNTAHEGAALGKEWHQIWAPIRVVGGIASLAPVAGGFCIAQLLVIQITTWGVGFANKVWDSYQANFLFNRKSYS